MGDVGDGRFTVKESLRRLNGWNIPPTKILWLFVGL